MKKSIILLVCLMAVSSIAFATTWGSKSISCPVCGKTDTYQTPLSYGSYVYQWPTKYQLIFWPMTDQNSHYICSECGFSCFMADFTHFDTTNTLKVKAMLEKEKPGLNFGSYTDYPILKRLDLSEKCYKAMNKDEYFWCEYYRVKAYFYDSEKDSTGAKRYRMKALGLAEQMLGMEKYQPIAKELLFVAASMYFYTGHDKEAVENLRTCKQVTYKGIEMDSKNAESLNSYLMELIEEMLMIIEQKTGK